MPRHEMNYDIKKVAYNLDSYIKQQTAIGRNEEPILRHVREATCLNMKTTYYPLFTFLRAGVSKGKENSQD